MIQAKIDVLILVGADFDVDGFERFQDEVDVQIPHAKVRLPFTLLFRRKLVVGSRRLNLLCWEDSRLEKKT